MASRRSRGKAVDHSTSWSEWTYHEPENYYYRFRYDAAGTIEYEYGRSQDPDPAVPRSQNVDSARPYDSVAVASPTSTHSAESNEDYTIKPADARGGNSPTPTPTISTSEYAGSNLTVSHHESLANSSHEESWPAPYASEPGSSSPLTSSLSTLKPPTGSSGAVYGSTSQTYDDLATNLESLNIASHANYSSTSTYPAPAVQYAPQYPSPYSSSTGQGQASEPYSQYGSLGEASSQYPQAIQKSPKESLDPRFREVVDNKLKQKFWRVGRVFMVLWTEPAGTGMHPEDQKFSQVSNTWLGGKAFTEIRRFVIVQAQWGNAICCPIHTYGGQATLKPNLPDQKQHAIIYTSDEPPEEFHYIAANGAAVWENLSKDPIRVRSERDGPEGELGNLSRINYSKIYTIEHNIQVMNIGIVEEKFIPALRRGSMVSRTEPLGRPTPHPPRHDQKKGRGNKKK